MYENAGYTYLPAYNPLLEAWKRNQGTTHKCGHPKSLANWQSQNGAWVCRACTTARSQASYRGIPSGPEREAFVKAWADDFHTQVVQGNRYTRAPELDLIVHPDATDEPHLTCRRGHPYYAFNRFHYKPKPWVRNCRACAAARDYQYRCEQQGNALLMTLEEYADDFYRRLYTMWQGGRTYDWETLLAAYELDRA